jgi:parallel beta helix pectate lyase-like protein
MRLRARFRRPFGHDLWARPIFRALPRASSLGDPALAPFPDRGAALASGCGLGHIRPYVGPILLLLNGLVPPLDARTWRVNVAGTGDAPTIQAAIDSASAGDTVLLGPGTYLWSSQAASQHSMIILKRGLTLRGDAGPLATILDAERNGRVMLLYDVGASLIEGLTIQTGRGRSAAGPPFLWSFGGGMYIAGDSNPTIANCIIRDNSVNTTQRGAGIYCESAVIENCQVLENFGNLDARGIGIWSDSTLVVRGTTFRGNWVNGDSGSFGAGLAARGNATITDCWIEGNRTSGVNGASSAGVSIAAGVVERCVFLGNEVYGGFGGARGGALGAGSGVEVRDCIFVANRVVGNPAVGAAMRLRGATVTRCTILGNIAEGGGTPIAGIYFDEPITVTSSLFAWNQGAVCSGVGNWSCNDIFGNTLGDAVCGTDGGGNFSLDPELCAVDPAGSMNFTLQADSPCAAGQHPEGIPCGLVGAAPVGCGPVSVQMSTWSHVKGLFRE